MNIGVIKTLGQVLNGFGVNTGTGFGIILYLDGQIAFNAFDKDGIENIHVWMGAKDMIFAGGSLPFKGMTRGEGMVPLTPVIDIFQVPVP